MQDNEPINLTYGQVSDMVNRIEQIPPLTGSGAPTAQTPAFYTGQTYVDTDTNDVYVCKEIDDTTSPTTYTWGVAGSSYTAGEAIDITNDVISATNTGKAKVLTTDDYNYPTTGTKTRVALWLLDDGIYYVPLEIQTSANTMYSGPDAGLVLVSHDHRTSNGLVRIDTFDTNNAQYVYLDHEDGSPYNSSQYVLLSGTVQNNLTSTSGTMPLAANQGRVLKALIDSIAIRGAGAPTTSTVGEVGQLYEDGTNGALYQLKSIDITVTPNTYNWEQVGSGGGGGGVTELTSADYNYHSSGSTDDGLAPWLLEPGMYYIKATPVSPIRLYSSSSSASSLAQNESLIINKTTVSGDPMTNVISYTNSGNIWSVDYNASGTRKKEGQIITSNNLVSSTGTSTTDVMSQNATTSMVFKNSSTLEGIRIGKDGVNVPNGTGATGIGDALTNGNRPVAIGNGSLDTTYRTRATGDDSVAIGTSASVLGYKGGIALGAYSNVSSVGEMNIGSSDTTAGYNNSNYRLLSGLYDPQSAHDAATKGYVDGLVGNIASALQTLNQGTGA